MNTELGGIRVPFACIHMGHPDWDDGAFYAGWLRANKITKRAPIEWLVGTQCSVDDDFMTRPLHVPIRVCVVDGVY